MPSPVSHDTVHDMVSETARGRCWIRSLTYYAVKVVGEERPVLFAGAEICLSWMKRGKLRDGTNVSNTFASLYLFVRITYQLIHIMEKLKELR